MSAAIMNETMVDHETRLRVLERIAESIDRRFDKLDQKIDSNFHWTLGLIIGQMVTTLVMFGGLLGTVVLHSAKLT